MPHFATNPARQHVPSHPQVIGPDLSTAHRSPSPALCCSFVYGMIVGTGIDLIEIERIQHSIDRFGERFLNRVYTAGEKAYCLRKRLYAESFAARFAAKEAGAKALGTGISHGVSWLEIEVVREPSG